MKPRRDVEETFKIGLTLKEKTKKKAEASSELLFQIETTIRTENRENREQKKSITQ